MNRRFVHDLFATGLNLRALQHGKHPTLVPLLPGNILVKAEDFRAGGFEYPPCRRDQLKADRFQGLELEDIRALDRRGSSFGLVGVDLKVPDQIIGQN